MSRRIIILLILLLLGTNFYGLIHNSTYLLLPILAYFTLVSKPHSLFRKPILIFLLLLIISSFTCLFFRKQAILETLRTPYYITFYGILIYFYIQKRQYRSQEIEKVLTILYICFITCFLVQYYYYPHKIFDLLVSNENEHRFRMMGQLINSLGYYFYLSKVLSKGKVSNFILCIAGFIVMILLGFRMMIFSCVLTSLIYICHYKQFKIKSLFKLSILGLILVTIALKIPVIQNSVNTMIERQEQEQSYSNPDYVRYAQLDYFLHQHFYNNLEYFLGSGMPHPNSTYGKKMTLDKDDYTNTFTIGWYDWGLIGLSWIIGIPAILCLLYIIFKCIKYSFSLDKHKWYIAYWYIFLIIISINNTELFRNNGFIFHGVVLYLLEEYLKAKNKNEITKTTIHRYC